MTYQEFQPIELLLPFIKCYYIFEPDLYEDKAYATGCVEIMFNLGEGHWQVKDGKDYSTNPAVELWGQILQPLSFRSIGKNMMLGVRFHPHAASVFLNEDISLFNSRITDLSDVCGKPVKEIYNKLQETASLEQRIALLDEFFLTKLVTIENKLKKTALINQVMKEMKKPGFYDNIDNLSRSYGISSRYMQKLFVQHTGLSPKMFAKINRFQNSMQLIAKQQLSLTAIAYESGYFDQSHFIREFRSFTGNTPSSFEIGNSSAILASSTR